MSVPEVCATCRTRPVPPTRSVCEACYPPSIAESERDRYRAALEMLAQVRSVSGSAQAHMRAQLRTIDAVLQGADVRNIEEVEAIAAGTWKAVRT